MKYKRKIYKKLFGYLTIVLALILSASTTAAANSSLPYETYNFDYWEYIYYTPAAYVPDSSLSGKDIGVGSLSNPQDLFAAADGKIYIADTGNNRILILNTDLTLNKVIENFDNNGSQDTFLNPYGVFVTGQNELYVADMDHNRIVALNKNGELIRIIDNPVSEVLSDNFTFIPMKVTVDYANRVYVIAKNMFQGIMAFDENGDFTGFTGTIKVTISTYEKIWRRFSTKAQRARQVQFIPTEFTGVDMAPDGFVYATNIDTKGTQSVRRLNPKGQDVIKKKSGGLSGDLWYRLVGEYSGASRIADIAYRDNGIYSIIDQTRGRIFTYDHEGNILYIFGGRGSQKGTFKNPVAIEAIGDTILVLDAGRGEVMTFTAAEYGKLINEAVALRFRGDESAAVELWKKVLLLDENFELAYVGIGKSYLAAGENQKAMEYLKLGMDRSYYSIAYKRYRDDILKENLGSILTIGALLVAGTGIILNVKRRGGKPEHE
jgi:DNA-binding beta-propeller fold protein YncE